LTIVATIEARMTSSRLPGKVLMEAGDKPLLYILIERLQQVPELDRIVLATTHNATDDPLESLAHALGIDVFRGSEEDVLGRVDGALRSANASIAVEITGDCPLTDPRMVSTMVAQFLATRGRHAYVANTTGPELGSPHGLDVQVFEAQALHKIAAEEMDAEAREHVSLPFYRASGVPRWNPRFVTFFPHRLCRKVWLSLDYRQDYELIRDVYETLAPTDPWFGAEAMIEAALARPAQTDACLALRGW
jgi:spore coat polysaccharide biosynthesis protein SpsF